MIENYIFDLGNVLLALDFDEAKTNFIQLGWKEYETFFSATDVHSFFINFEVGDISSDQFISEILNHVDKNSTIINVVDAWNSMLISFWDDRIEYIKKLRLKGHKVFLLSNTNEIHQMFFEALYFKTYNENFHAIFNKVYYSHYVGIRKPNREIYDLLLKENFLNPEFTLFIDDNENNILTAKDLGLKTLWLNSANASFDFNNFDFENLVNQYSL